MSEIFSPGSVAGPQGPSGAAGSLANVKSLTDNVLPNMTQLFDCTRTAVGYTVNSDGTLGAFSGFSASPFIYCPGALYAVSDIPIRLQGGYCYFAFYDANANFLDSVTSFVGITLAGGVIIPAGTPFPLPGTQTYVRFTWADGAFGSSWAASVTSASFCAGVTTPSIPSPFQPFGFDTVADVNTKIASFSTVPGIAGAQFARRALAGGPLGTRNAFNYRDLLNGYSVMTNGTLLANSNWVTATVYAPNSTSMIANIPFYCRPDANATICAYDDAGNFIADVSSNFTSVLDGNGRYPGNVVVTLPGNQTYLKFSYLAGWLGASEGWGGSPESAVFYSGTAADPPPSALTSANSSIPFVGNLSATRRTATELGASADQQSDFTAVLNAFLATASAANPIELVLDGMFATTGLVISPNGYTTISGLGLGTGIMLDGFTTQDGIRIGPYTAATGDSEGAYNIAVPTRTATNIILRDFTVNPNSLPGEGGQSDAAANQPVSGAIAHATYGVILTSATNILVDNVSFLQAATYALCLSNVGFAKVTNCKFNSTGTIHDGIHIDGPSEDIGIMNCDITTGDDGIALNSPEGYGGDISRVTVTNCRFNGSLSVMRLYTSVDTTHMPTNNVHKIRNVVVSNCTGTVRGTCFVVGLYGGGYSSTTSVDQIQDFLVDNCTLSGFNGLAVLANTAGTITFRGVNFIPTGTDPVISVNYQVSELVLDGVAILRNPDGNDAPGGLISVSGILGRLTLRNCRVVDEDGSSYTPVPYMLNIAAATGVLQLEAVDLTHVTALLSSSGWTNVALVRGSGVMATGTQVPDSVMDNNVLYLSSNASGAPSIKLGGTAKQLTLT